MSLRNLASNCLPYYDANGYQQTHLKWIDASDYWMVYTENGWDGIAFVHKDFINNINKGCPFNDRILNGKTIRQRNYYFIVNKN